VGALLRRIGLPVCVGWFALLWKGWLKVIQNISQESASFASANRFARLCWLVCSSVEGVAKGYSKQLPREWELCFGESVCPFVLVGLLFCGGDDFRVKWLWVVVGGCGWLWVVVGGCGWLWVVVGGCGWLWMVVPPICTTTIC
jgi:hypothetical protein